MENSDYCSLHRDYKSGRDTRHTADGQPSDNTKTKDETTASGNELRSTDGASDSGELRSKEQTEQFTSLIRALAGRDRAAVTKAKAYPCAFLVDDTRVKQLDRIVRKAIGELDTVQDTFSVQATVRYRDFTVDRYSTLDELLEDAGNRLDPETLSIRWEATLQSPRLSEVFVDIEFQTDAGMNTEELGLLDFHLASMKFQVAGPTRKWVESAFLEVEPFFPSIKLGGIYKPLLIFRNRAIVHILSIGLGVFAQLLISSYMRQSVETQTNDGRLKQIKSATSAEDKIDLLVELFFTQRAPIFETIGIFISGFMLMLITMVLGFWLLPKLVPRSGIALGLSRHRYLEYENAFKMIVFTIGVSGLLLPVVRKLLGW